MKPNVTRLEVIDRDVAQPAYFKSMAAARWKERNARHERSVMSVARWAFDAPDDIEAILSGSRIAAAVMRVDVVEQQPGHFHRQEVAVRAALQIEVTHGDA